MQSEQNSLQNMPKLFLSKIELENFKSFKGKHIVEFNPQNFTVLTGKNGNGKSNILDSILFTLGFKSKYLRQNKLQDLIYNFNNEKMSYATVQLTFTSQNEQFQISRTVKQNGNSQYFINQQKCTLEEIQNKLLNSGLDIKHNRFLILQGEVESISMLKSMGQDVMQNMIQQQLLNIQILSDLCYKMQQQFDVYKYDEIYQYFEQLALTTQLPEQIASNFAKIKPLQQVEISSDDGLLEFIESVVGTQDQIPSIAKQAALVEYVNQGLNEARNQLQQAVTFKTDLEDVKNESVTEIRKYIKGEQKQMEYNMFQASNGRFQCNILNKENIKIQEKLTQLAETDNSQLTQRNDELKQQLKQISQEKEQIENQMNNKNNQLKQQEVQQAVSEEKLTELQKNILSVNKNIEKQNNKLHSLTLQKEAMPLQQKQLNQEIEQITKQMQQLQLTLDQLSVSKEEESRVQKLRSEISRQEQALQQIVQNRINLEQNQQMQKENISQIINVMTTQLQVLYNNLYSIVNISTQQDINGPKLLQEKEQLEQFLKQSNLQQKTQQIQKVEEQLQQIIQQMQQIDSQIQEIKNNNQDNSKYSKLLTELMLAAQHGVIKGVYGRLGSLGTIDPQFNNAAIAAFNKQLDIILCENIDSIQQCLQFIQEKKLGSATFLDLQQATTRYQKYQNNINTQFLNQNNGKLFLSLVQTQPQFIPGFWQIMQETILTDNNQNALILNRYNNRQKLRIVTIEGNLFEKSGALTGGNIKELIDTCRGFTEMINVNDQQIIQQLQQQYNQVEIKQKETQQYLKQLQQEYKQYTVKQHQLEQVNEKLEANQQQQFEQIEQVKNNIINILNINKNPVLIQMKIIVNQQLTQQIQQLYKQLTQNQNVNIGEFIPSIIELFQYYAENKLKNQQQLLQYLASFDKRGALYEIFTSEDSLLFNLLEINDEQIKDLKLTELEQQEQQIQHEKEKEQLLSQQIQMLQDKLNDSETQKLKLQISKLNSKIQEKEQKLTEFAIFIERFDNQINQIQLIIQQYNIDLQQFNSQQEEQLQINNQLNQQITQLKEFIKAEQQQFEAISQQINTINNEINTINQQLEQQQSEKVKLEQKQINNQKQINQNAIQIEKSEKIIKIYYEDLRLLNEKLELVGEKIDFIIPKFSDYEMQNELENYDQYVISNFNNAKEGNFVREGELISLFPQQFQVLQDYSNRSKTIIEMQEKFSQVAVQVDQQTEQLNRMKQIRQDQFISALTVINTHLRTIYRTFSIGGQAQLDPVDPFDVFQGIQFNVMPPKKSWRPISLLSGGEKTLSSLSLIFALHFYKNNFLYVVDEIDAALDWKNVQLVANYMKSLKGCQFVVVSLRNGCFEQADEIVGVYKRNGESQIIQAVM